jgi:Xaa-Pro dipeptidase
MAYLDRGRAEHLMAQENLDAIILFAPESFAYATGCPAGVATMWRKTGAVAVLVPADPAISEMAVVSDLFAANFRKTSHINDIRESPIWVEATNLEGVILDGSAVDIIASAWDTAKRSSGFERPTTFDPERCYAHLADALSERGLTKARIGIEADAISARDLSEISRILSPAQLVDASDTIHRIKMVKSDPEIANLRQAVSISECGLKAVHQAISQGVSRNQLAAAWLTGIHSHPDHVRLSGNWEYISVGTNPWGGNAKIQPGDLIKVDVGCLVDGYSSDTGRTFVYDRPNRLQSSLFDALMSGFEAGSKLLAPGVALSEVHRVTQNAIRSAGFDRYTRGHFGHGLGAGLGSEEWPFISADASVEFEAGMVIAFECPWYIDGVGGMIIENQVLITETGHEMMNTLPLGLGVIPT